MTQAPLGEDYQPTGALGTGGTTFVLALETAARALKMAHKRWNAQPPP